MNIKELDKRTGITKQNIRFYEKRGLLSPARNTVNNYREYSEPDVKRLQIIRALRKLDISIDDIRSILAEEIPMEDVMQAQLEILQKRQKELDAGIHICQSLLHTSLKNLDMEQLLQRMEAMEEEGGAFMTIVNDYKILAKAEAKREFSFMPDNMAFTPAEFTEALFKYADENHLNLVITREGMYPVFEIDGVEYTAERRFGRFGAVICCTMTHPEDLEKELWTVPKGRRKVFRVLYRYMLPIGLLLYFMAVSKSVGLGLLMGACIIPAFIWVFRGIR